MSENRIQKLLFKEYCVFEDIVLIESPFAQTTKEGIGVRQVQMGLTPTKLILAGDMQEKEASDPTIQMDPEIGTLEMLSLFPVECVNMSIYRRKNRNTLKAHFCNNQVIYFELAASFKRDMYWNLWCERIKFLNPEDESPLSTYSETSVGSTSVSTSTAYGSKTVKCYKRRWDEKDLFLGEKFGQNESIITRQPVGEIHVPREKDTGNARKTGNCSRISIVNRFGHGIPENCCTHLFLPVEVYAGPLFDYSSSYTSADVEDIRESKTLGVLNTPLVMRQETDKRRTYKHIRRYGVAPVGALFYGLGSLRFDRPQAFSLQIKRCSSEVYISQIESKTDDLLGFPRRLLTSSLSSECLIEYNKPSKGQDNTPVRGSTMYNYYHGDYIFWTPNFWFRPMKARYGYKRLMRHQGNLRFYLRNKGGGFEENFLINSLINSKKIELEVSSWDFNSTIIAYQLTAIDRDLFMQIPLDELSVLLFERSASNAPYTRAMIAFAERIVDLVTSEIIRLDSVKLRAKLIAKYINVARRLEHLQNLHTTKTILSSLQTPAIYRLKKTWSYLRIHHNNKYRRLYSMLKTHKEVRSRTYGLFFGTVTETKPFLPSLLHVIAALFGRLSPELLTLMSYSASNEPCNKECCKVTNNNNNYLCPTISDDSNISETILTRSLTSSSSSLNVEKVLNRLISQPENNLLLTINLSKTNSHMQRMMSCMEEWQIIANQFGLIENPILKEFLLKSRYMEQNECFAMSLKMEPPDLLLKQTPDIRKSGN